MSSSRAAGAANEPDFSGAGLIRFAEAIRVQ
jgi:hypothetical protein